MSKDRYESVQAPTRTDAEMAKAREYHIKQYRACVLALAVAALRLEQLRVPIPLVEIDPDQLRFDVL